MTSVLLSLASQFNPAGPSAARFYVLDGAPQDGQVSGALARVCEVLPHAITRGGRHDAAAILIELAQEVERRLDAESRCGPTLFVFLSDLGRFRSLRRSDEFGFAATSDPADPTAALDTILRDGPPLGIYVIAWCDGLGNLNRIFNRNAQHEFGAKVAFQMGTSDSVQLLDTPLASKLGQHRALFLDEEQGIVEKFRPYSPPPPEWLAWVRERLRNRESAFTPGDTDPIL